MKKFIEKIIDFFCSHCPECNGRMNSEMFDMTIDKMVYKCTVCGKRWVVL